MEHPIRVVLQWITADYSPARNNHHHHYSGDDDYDMGANYNIHGTDDDLYYYCPSNDCPCRGSSDHRGNDNYLVFYYDNNDYSWEHHLINYSPPDDSATDDDYQHYDHIFGSYNDGDDFHPAYRTAYNDYLATKRQPTTA
jgi:hypothetical protein